MFKHLLNAHGVTTALLQAGSSAVAVDAGVYGAISAVLGIGDWSYLQIQDYAHTEIVKVLAAVGANTLVIRRAREGTRPYTFLTRASIDYVDTASAILDSVALYPLVLEQADGIVVTDDNAVEYAPVTIGVVGGIESAGMRLGLRMESTGCCTLIPQLPPPLPNILPYRVTGDNDYRTTGDDDYRVPL